MMRAFVSESFTVLKFHGRSEYHTAVFNQIFKGLCFYLVIFLCILCLTAILLHFLLEDEKTSFLWHFRAVQTLQKCIGKRISHTWSTQLDAVEPQAHTASIRQVIASFVCLQLPADLLYYLFVSGFWACCFTRNGGKSGSSLKMLLCVLFLSLVCSWDLSSSYLSSLASFACSLSSRGENFQFFYEDLANLSCGTSSPSSPSSCFSSSSSSSVHSRASQASSSSSWLIFASAEGTHSHPSENLLFSQISIASTCSKAPNYFDQFNKVEDEEKGVKSNISGLLRYDDLPKEGLFTIPYTVSCENRVCEINGCPTLIISAGFSYLKTSLREWDKIFSNIALSGCNAVETEIWWEEFQPFPDSNFMTRFSSKFERLKNFVQLAAAHNLFVILRVGPFLGPRWRNFGYPSWATAYKEGYEGYDSSILRAKMYELVVAYWKSIIEELEPLMAPVSGGPLVLLQFDHSTDLSNSKHTSAGLLNRISSMLSSLKKRILPLFGKRFSFATKESSSVDVTASLSLAEVVESLHLKIPWLSYRLPTAQVKACIGYYCGRPKGNLKEKDWFDETCRSKKQPCAWIEAWTGPTVFWEGFDSSKSALATARDGSRVSEDLLFAVLRFVSQGGSIISYYPFVSETNFGRQGGYFQSTSQDSGQPLDEFGSARSPKFPAIMRLNSIIDEFMKDFVFGDSKFGYPKASFLLGDVEAFFLPNIITFCNYHERRSRLVRLSYHERLLIEAWSCLIYNTKRKAIVYSTREALWKSEKSPEAANEGFSTGLTYFSPIPEKSMVFSALKSGPQFCENESAYTKNTNSWNSWQLTLGLTDYAWYSFFLPPSDSGNKAKSLVSDEFNEDTSQRHIPSDSHISQGASSNKTPSVLAKSSSSSSPSPPASRSRSPPLSPSSSSSSLYEEKSIYFTALEAKAGDSKGKERGVLEIPPISGGDVNFVFCDGQLVFVGSPAKPKKKLNILLPGNASFVDIISVNMGGNSRLVERILQGGEADFSKNFTDFPSALRLYEEYHRYSTPLRNSAPNLSFLANFFQQKMPDFMFYKQNTSLLQRLPPASLSWKGEPIYFMQRCFGLRGENPSLDHPWEAETSYLQKFNVSAFNHMLYNAFLVAEEASTQSLEAEKDVKNTSNKQEKKLVDADLSPPIKIPSNLNMGRPAHEAKGRVIRKSQMFLELEEAEKKLPNALRIRNSLIRGGVYQNDDKESEEGKLEEKEEDGFREDRQHKREEKDSLLGRSKFFYSSSDSLGYMISRSFNYLMPSNSTGNNAVAKETLSLRDSPYGKSVFFGNQLDLSGDLGSAMQWFYLLFDIPHVSFKQAKYVLLLRDSESDNEEIVDNTSSSNRIFRFFSNYFHGKNPIAGIFSGASMRREINGMTKGFAYINGHHLGRYWLLGRAIVSNGNVQYSFGSSDFLKIPAEWLKKGENVVLLMEEIQGNPKYVTIREERFKTSQLSRILLNFLNSWGYILVSFFVAFAALTIILQCLWKAIEKELMFSFTRWLRSAA